MGDHHIEKPAWMKRDVDCVAQVKLQRPPVVALIPLAISEDGAVSCDHQSLEASSGHPFDQLRCVFARAIKIELHPHPTADLGSDFLQGNCRCIAQDERDAGLGGRSCECDVSSVGQEAVEASRSDEEW